jgi:hypothetical protein
MERQDTRRHPTFVLSYMQREWMQSGGKGLRSEECDEARQWRTQERFPVGGGVQQIQLRTAGRENGDLRAVAPLSGVLLNLQMSEPRILIRLLRIYFPRNWEFGLALLNLRNFGRGRRG